MTTLPLPPASRLMAQHISVGVLQGLLATFLYYAREHRLWPVTATAECLHMLVLCVGVLPWAVYLSSAVGLPLRRRVVLLGGITLLSAGLGGYSGWLEHAPDTQPDLSPAVIQALAAMVMTFLVVPLVAAWQPADASPRWLGRWSYPLLFQVAWRNALAMPVAMALTGICWGVLWAGAGLLSVIGLGAVAALLQWPPIIFGVSCVVLGVAFAQGILRADLLLNLRRFVLTLNSWLLPLLLGFGVAWVCALPFTGLQRLFATGSAAFMLLGFLVLAVIFLNAAWQDGHEPPPYGVWLSRLVAGACLTLPVISGVSLWALVLRVRQYGFTESRIWACVAAVLLAGYTAGYVMSLWPGKARKVWMPSIGQTNIAMALCVMICLTLLVSPLADPRRLAVQDQVQRLLSRQIAPEAFDFDYLAHQGGRWGKTALETLSLLDGEKWQRVIARRASDTLKGEPEEEEQESPKTLLDVRSHLVLLADTPMPDDEFLSRFLSPSMSWQEQMCWSAETRCAVYQLDLNADGLKEMLLIVQSGDSASAHVYTRQNGPWEYVAQYSMSSAPWVKAILEQTLRVKRQGWPELDVGGTLMKPVQVY